MASRNRSQVREPISTGRASSGAERKDYLTASSPCPRPAVVLALAPLAQGSAFLEPLPLAARLLDGGAVAPIEKTNDRIADNVQTLIAQANQASGAPP